MKNHPTKDMNPPLHHQKQPERSPVMVANYSLVLQTTKIPVKKEPMVCKNLPNKNTLFLI